MTHTMRIFGWIVATLLLFTPLFSAAQTTSAGSDQQISALQSLIDQLQDIIKRISQYETQATGNTYVGSTIQFPSFSGFSFPGVGSSTASSFGAVFSIEPGKGVAPLFVSVNAPAYCSQSDITISWGDSSVPGALKCTFGGAVSHMFNAPGTFSVEIRKGSEIVSQRTITVSKPVFNLPTDTLKGTSVVSAITVEQSSVCKSATTNYGIGSTVDRQIIIGGPISFLIASPSFTCTAGLWKCTSQCGSDVGKLFVYDPTVLEKLREVTQ